MWSKKSKVILKNSSTIYIFARNVAVHSRLAVFTITKVCHSVRSTFMQSAVHSARAAANRSWVAALLRCTRNITQSILSAHSVYIRSIREHLKNNTINRTVIPALINYSVKCSHAIREHSNNSMTNRSVTPALINFWLIVVIYPCVSQTLSPAVNCHREILMSADLQIGVRQTRLDYQPVAVFPCAEFVILSATWKTCIKQLAYCTAAVSLHNLSKR